MGRYSQASNEEIAELLKTVSEPTIIGDLEEQIVVCLKEAGPSTSEEVANELEGRQIVFDDRMFLSAFKNLIEARRVTVKHAEGWVAT